MYKSRLAWLAGMAVGLAAGATPIVGGAVYFYALIGKLFSGCEVFSDCMVAVSISPMVVFLMVCGAIMLRDILKGD
jgi:uncharacterized protein (DUF2062 family)